MWKSIDLGRRSRLRTFTLLFALIFGQSTIGYSQVANCSWAPLGNSGFTPGTAEWMDIAYHPITGELYMAFQDESNSDKAAVMKFNGSSWALVGSSGLSQGQAFSLDIEFDSSGIPYVMFRDMNHGGYTVMKWDDVIMSWVSVGSPNFSGFGNGNGSMALHPISQQPYVAYPDLSGAVTSNSLSVMYFDGSTWGPAGGSLGITAAGVGMPEITFDASGTAYVGFTDFSQSSKMSVMQFDGVSWSYVGTPGFNSGSSEWPTVRVDPSTGEPWAVCKIATNLHAYKFSAGTWTTQPAIPGTVGNQSPLTIGFEFEPSTGTPFICFQSLSFSPFSYGLSCVALETGVWNQVGGPMIIMGIANSQCMAVLPGENLAIGFRDPTVDGANGGSVLVLNCVPPTPGCMDAAACNYNDQATEDDGSCIYPGVCDTCTGETDGTGVIIDGDVDDDGVCDVDEVSGCTDPVACNYDPAATDEDGSCVLPDGCTDPGACNYDPAATCDDGSCVLPDGCTDPIACNYDPAALCNDGSCTYSSSAVFGCTYNAALNFDPAANIDDGSCEYAGCTDPVATNYNPVFTTDDGSCQYSCLGDLNGDEAINTGDIVLLLSIFGSVCN